MGRLAMARSCHDLRTRFVDPRARRRRCNRTYAAGITSIEVVLNNTGVMLWWAALIVGLTVVALLLPWSLGLLLVGPLLGHGSWHAYRGSVRWLPTS